jgi:signal peptidase I
MLPTLQIHDVLLVDKFEYRFHPPNEGDVVVFPPPVPTPDDFIKRVIGRPGDTLRVANGTVYLNGKGLSEPYVAERPSYSLEIRDYGIYVSYGAGWQRLDSTEANVPPASFWMAPNRIPPHCYIMFGDNRNDSEDSHIWGFAQDSGHFATGSRTGAAAGFTGRAFLIFWPPSQAKIL